MNTGSANEKDTQQGISHFLEHMAFKGTKKRTYFDISNDAEQLGANMNAFTSQDLTAYFIEGLYQHRSIFLDILADIITNSTFPKEEIEKERDVILQEYAMYNDRPSSVANTNFNLTAWGNTPWGRSVIGTPEHIKSFQRKDLIAYMKQHYHGSNIIIGISGYFETTFDAVVREIESLFGNITKSPKGISFRETPTWNNAHQTNHPMELAQTSVVMGYQCPGYNDGGLHYNVAAMVLGHGMSSPLFQEIREKRGLVYGVSSGVDSNPNHGSFKISAATSPDKLKELIDAVKELITKLSKKVEPGDLNRAVNNMLVEIISIDHNPLMKLVDTANEMFNYGKIETSEAIKEKIQKLTVEDLQKVFLSLSVVDPVISIAGAVS